MATNIIYVGGGKMVLRLQNSDDKKDDLEESDSPMGYMSEFLKNKKKKKQ